MFCSPTCRDDFHETFDGSKYLRSQLHKMFREAEKDFGSRMEFAVAAWMQRAGDHTLQRTTYFDCDLSNPEDPECKRKMWQCTLSMNELNRQVTGSMYDESIFEDDFYNDLFGKHLITKLHLKHIYKPFSEELTFPMFNMSRINLFGLRNFVKHSCVYNTMMFRFDGNKMVYCITKPIKAGEQLFRNHL